MKKLEKKVGQDQEGQKFCSHDILVPISSKEAFRFITKNAERIISLLEWVVVGVKDEILTSLDLFSIQDEISDKKLIELVRTNLSLTECTNNLPPEILEDLWECFEFAKDFLEKYLLISLPEEIKVKTSFKSTADFLSFIRKSTMLRVSGKKINQRKSLSRYALDYCAVIKLMLIYWELKNKNYENLEQEAEYFFDKLIKLNDKYSEDAIFHKHSSIDSNWDRIGVFLSGMYQEDPPISYAETHMSSRVKDQERSVSKMVIKPGQDIMKVLTDGIWVRFEVYSQKHAEALLTTLVSNLDERLWVTGLTIKDNNLLDVEKVFLVDKSQNRKRIIEFDNREILIEKQDNHSSADGFKSVSIKWIVKVPVQWKENMWFEERNFEIQIYYIWNENEQWMSRHEIYEAKQRLSVFTRLYWMFDAKYLDRICKQAAKSVCKDGADILCMENWSNVDVISWKIKDHILQRDSMEKSNIIPFTIKTNSRSVERFVAKNQVDRWLKSDWVPERYKKAFSFYYKEAA